MAFLKRVNSFLKKWLAGRRRTVLFHRDYLRFQGGHLKVSDYYQHLAQLEEFSTCIYFTPRSIPMTASLWPVSERVDVWNPADADILFLAGLDWQAVLEDQDYLQVRKNIPVINLIQGLSHADPDDIKYPFLSEPAIRICVSDQVAQAIEGTGRVNGPVFTIPNGIHVDNLTKPVDATTKLIKVLIIANKKPELGQKLQAELLKLGIHADLITELQPRTHFLEALGKARICVFLPHIAEGFYLPALEAMALGCIVVCPDCVGNRSFCVDKVTCFRPVYDIQAIKKSVIEAVNLPEHEFEKMRATAFDRASKHSLEREREQFLGIMKNIDYLWEKIGT